MNNNWHLCTILNTAKNFHIFLFKHNAHVYLVPGHAHQAIEYNEISHVPFTQSCNLTFEQIVHTCVGPWGYTYVRTLDWRKKFGEYN